MYTQKDKNSVRYAAALYRSRRKKRNIRLELGVFFSVLIPVFSTLLAILISRPV